MEYKLYSLSTADHIEASVEISSATDEDARSQAAALLGTYAAIEIWQGTRIVGRVRQNLKPGGPSRRWEKLLRFVAGRTLPWQPRRWD
jgi:hypothetical protein